MKKSVALFIHRFRRLATALCLIAGVGLLPGLEAKTQEHEHHEHGDHHAHHRQMLEQTGYVRSEHRYQVPDLVLVDRHGQKVSLAEALDGAGPVLLNFIFTSCTTICPVLSGTFAQAQGSLGPGREEVRMYSVSIDPEQDTPARLSEYAQRYRAGDSWHFLTGSRDDVLAVQKAFDAYRGSKMNHIPLTFMRASPDAPWTRLEGFASTADLLREYEALPSP
ncbi:MAG: SCO family protein [Pseudomonadota bacterium]|nr:SCO family protein [Pseudomonadota bacterium]